MSPWGSGFLSQQDSEMKEKALFLFCSDFKEKWRCIWAGFGLGPSNVNPVHGPKSAQFQVSLFDKRKGSDRTSQNENETS